MQISRSKGTPLTDWTAPGNRGRSSVSKNSFLGTLPDVKKAPEASNSYPSAYRGTVGYELRSKLKCYILREAQTFR